jgi:hypothetical protein
LASKDNFFLHADIPITKYQLEVAIPLPLASQNVNGDQDITWEIKIANGSLHKLDVEET